SVRARSRIERGQGDVRAGRSSGRRSGGSASERRGCADTARRRRRGRRTDGADVCSARRGRSRRRASVVRMTESARATPAIGNALAEGRRKTERNQLRPGLTGVLGLQRLAGNAAVNALLAAKGDAGHREETG